MKKDPLRRQSPGKYRIPVQIFFFILIAMIAAGHQLAEKGKTIAFLPNVSLHAVCPFGGVVSVYNLLATGRLVQRVHESALVLMILAFLLALLVGAAFCGWICPLGSVQEWIGKAGRKIFGKKYGKIVPAWLDRYLKYTRYLVLAWVVYATATAATLVFSDYDPYYALFNFLSGEVAVSALIILGATLMLSLVTERPWCRYACPYGALLGLTNKIRLFTIRRKGQACNQCQLCDRRCPVGIKVSEKRTVGDTHCISCLECTSDAACPQADTVDMEWRFDREGSVK